MLENASCDRYLGCLKETCLPDFDGIDVNNPRTNECEGVVYKQSPTEVRQVQFDPYHEQKNGVLNQLQNNNGGFVQNNADRTKAKTVQQKQQIMGYYPMGFLPAHHQLAKTFRPCDAWFCSVPGPTWPNRFFALSGTSNGLVVMPEKGKFLKTSRMIYSETQPTIFTRLAEQKISFKIFYHDFPSSMILLQNIINSEVRTSFTPFVDNFQKMAAGPESEFPQFSFIEAKYNGFDQNDDHPPHNVMKGQKLIADVYNSIRNNEELWNSTLIVILHDEHGGFYDHVTPPAAIPPREYKNSDEYDFTQLGVRVPALLVSPWVKPGVEKTIFDHTSLLKYLREKWNLGDLGDRVSSPKTNSIACALDFSKKYENSLLKIIVTEEQLQSPHPEWELDSTSHHFANDFFTHILEDNAGTELMRTISSKERIDIKFSKVFITKAALEIFIYFLKDVWTSIHSNKSMSVANRANRRKNKIDKIFENAESVSDNARLRR
jgi:phospholipase C